jgi:MFS family permease
MAGGGLALVIVPPLTDATSWRATYAAALALALAAAVPTGLVRGLRRAGQSPHSVLGDGRLLPLGLLQAATFGLAVVAGNWVVPLLERQDASATVAGALGGLILLAGIVTRPLGGGLTLRRPAGRGRLLVGSLTAVAAGSLLLAAGGPTWLSGLGALCLGLAAGLPFAALFEAAQRLRPDAPGAAVALVNTCAISAVLVGTPLAGLAFDLPGDGRVAFAAIAGLALAALPLVRRLPVSTDEVGSRRGDRRY